MLSSTVNRMIIINFGHPLTPDQRSQIEIICRRPAERVIDVPTQFEDDEAFDVQVARLVESVGMSGAAWQTSPVLINPPPYSPAAVVLLAYLHGLMGHFPTVIRIRPVDGSVPTRFEVAEVVSLETVREKARTQRGALRLEQEEP